MNNILYKKALYHVGLLAMLMLISCASQAKVMSKYEITHELTGKSVHIFCTAPKELSVLSSKAEILLSDSLRKYQIKVFTHSEDALSLSDKSPVDYAIAENTDYYLDFRVVSASMSQNNMFTFQMNKSESNVKIFDIKNKAIIWDAVITMHTSVGSAMSGTTISDGANTIVDGILSKLHEDQFIK